jgi:butyryl-CoA dehydrogenase/short/branched chain acyl-CoA dehydrogenase
MNRGMQATTKNPSALTVLTEEEELFRDMVRDFAEKEVRPLVSKMDRDMKIDPSLVPRLFDLGVMGIEIPEDHGGSGSSFFMAVGAYALSEPDSGSDAFALTCRAVADGDSYRLTGTKLWTTNGAEADIFIVFATVDPQAGYKGITAFLVERDYPGFRVGKKEDKLGIRASSTCELILEDCRVPRNGILGEVGKGYKIAIETLNEGRIGIGAQMIGLARGSLEHAMRYAKQRNAFGQPISKFQAIQFQIADCATGLEASRLMVYNAARLRDSGRPFLVEAAMAKLFSSNVAERVTSQVIEIYGGYGYTKDFPAEKYWRDSKIGKIYEGTSNMQLQTIAKYLLSDR